MFHDTSWEDGKIFLHQAFYIILQYEDQCKQKILWSPVCKQVKQDTERAEQVDRNSWNINQSLSLFLHRGF